ncbi:MAG: PepSY-associated TM helix domain-containing protein [Sphingorhabdus sp.]
MKRNWVSRLHAWIGLWLGAYLVLLGLTGAILVWRAEIDKALNPGLLTASYGKPVSVPMVLNALQKKHPVAEECSLFWPQQRDDVFLFACTENGTEFDLSVHPGTGEAIGERRTDLFGLSAPLIMPTLFRFHANLLLGEPGYLVAGSMAAIYLLLIFLGLRLWWPRKRAHWKHAFKIHWKGPWRRTYFELHRTSGAVASLALTIIVGTGIYLGTPQPIDAILQPQESPAKTAALLKSAGTIEDAIEYGAKIFPGAPPTDATFIFGEDSTITLFVQNDESLYRSTGMTTVMVEGPRITSRAWSSKSISQKISDSFFPLHTGDAVGFAGRIIWSLAGLFPAVLFFTGMRLSRRSVARKT